MKFTNLIALLSVISGTLSSPAFAGRGNDGGALTREQTKEVITQLVQDNGRILKARLADYLKSMDVNQIDIPVAKEFFSTNPGKPGIERDLLESPYEIRSACYQDTLTGKSRVSISTTYGEPGSSVCFDPEYLATDFSKLGASQIGIKLAGLVMHEHKHHFQTRTSLLQTGNLEQDAYRVGAYVEDTAAYINRPTLIWKPNANKRGGPVYQYSDPKVQPRQHGFATTVGASALTGGAVGLAAACILGAGFCALPPAANWGFMGVGAVAGALAGPFIYRSDLNQYNALLKLQEELVKSEFSITCDNYSLTMTSGPTSNPTTFVIVRTPAVGANRNSQPSAIWYDQNNQPMVEGVPVILVPSIKEMLACDSEEAAVKLEPEIKASALATLEQLKAQGYLPAK